MQELARTKAPPYGHSAFGLRENGVRDCPGISWDYPLDYLEFPKRVCASCVATEADVSGPLMKSELKNGCFLTRHEVETKNSPI